MVKQKGRNGRRSIKDIAISGPLTIAQFVKFNLWFTSLSLTKQLFKKGKTLIDRYLDIKN